MMNTGKYSPNRSSSSGSVFSMNDSITGYTELEKKDLNKIPLYKMLKHYTL